MSYILDALRRADAERERGSVPGLHAQLVPERTGDDAPRARAVPPWVGFAAGALAVVAAVVAWQWLSHDEKRAEPAVTAQAPAAARFDDPAAAAPTAPPPPAAMPAQAPAKPRPAPTPQPAPVRAQAPLPAVVPAARPTPARDAAPTPNATSRAATANGDNRVVAMNELPDNIRAELPTLNVGGSMFSSDAASRFLIINGQILHEGEKLGPELSLEEIRLKAAVLRYKSYRFLVRF